MFEGCHRLKELDISNFNFNKVKKIENFFKFCDDLENIIIPDIKDNIPSSIKKIFLEIKNQTNINI